MEQLLEELEKEEQKTQEQLQEYQKYLEYIEEFQKDIELLSKVKTLDELNSLLDSRMITYKDNTFLLIKYQNLKYLIESSYRLFPLFNTLYKVKNRKSLIEKSKDKKSFNNEIKRCREKLNKNKFTFIDPLGIENILSLYITDDEAHLFIYSLARVINTQSKFIETHSLFLNQLFKNINNLDKESKYKDLLIENIKKYCEMCNK